MEHIIEWETFIRFKCFLVFFTLKTKELIGIWMKILDPQGVSRVNKKEFVRFLEMLAKGSITKEQTIISKQYSRNVVKLLEMEKCDIG